MHVDSAGFQAGHPERHRGPDPADPADPADDLAGAATALLRGYEGYRHRCADRANLRITELRALSWVVERGGLTPTQLADSLRLTTGAVTALSDRLVVLGLVERIPNPEDRRSTLLTATAAGLALITRLDADYRGAIRIALQQTHTPATPAITAFLLAASQTLAQDTALEQR